MIKLEKTEVFGWEAAIRGMRNPMNSWDKSDSGLTVTNPGDVEFGYAPNYEYVVGEADLKLMKSLSKAGSDHGKFLRFITVTIDITAPLYWWKEFDTYRVGVAPHPTDIEMNSCSTMHKITDKELTMDDFSCEHLNYCEGDEIDSLDILGDTIIIMNLYREKYLKTKNKNYWWQIIQLLPSSYNQKRTVQLNYQVLKAMYFARKDHKLDEWREFCKWIETLPYFSEICL